MKKYLSILFIALAGIFAATSCVDEKNLTVFDPANVVAQGLGNITGCILAADGEPINATFTPADFALAAPSTYVLYAAKAGTDFAEPVKVASTIDIKAGTISIAQKDMNNIILNMGGAGDVEFALDFKLIGYLMNDKNAPIESTAVESGIVTATFVPYEAELLDADIYDKVWIIGASATVGAWSHGDVYQFLYNYSKDGMTYKGTIFYGGAAADGWKITGTDGWVDDLNWGSEAQAEEAEAASVQLIAGGGSKDIKCYSMNYYVWEYNTSTLLLKKVCGFDNIGIVGDFNGWNQADADAKMQYNDAYHRFYIDWTFNDAAQLKFTADDKWDLNWGVGCANGGDNISVPAGSYRIYLDLNKNEYEFNARMFGKDEPGREIKEPDPVPPYEGWGIIGVGGDWDNDVAMTEKDGVWTGYVTLAAEDSWKLRKDAAWVDNFGGKFEALGTPFAAVAGGDNIEVGKAGFFKVELDTNASTITVSEGDVWSIIGAVAGTNWDKDLFMTLSDGKWTYNELSVADGDSFKLRHNCDWTLNYGGVFAELGVAFEAVEGGDNISVPAGKYNVTLDPAAKTITIENAAKSWGVIGVNGDWNNDIAMKEVMPGVWVSETITTTTDWKIRFDKGWDINRGCDAPKAVGEFVEAVAGGSNVNLTGTFQVVYNANNETIGTLGWGLIGGIASIGLNWDADVPMNLASDGKWYSIPVALTTADQFKIRYQANWDVNNGGKCEAAETAFAAAAGGENIVVPADGTYMVVYDPTAATIILSKMFWGAIGDFNSWGGDLFMMYTGTEWVAYNQAITGGWKIRQAAGWDVNRGGKFEAAGAAFAVVAGGENITVTGLETFDVIYDPAAETITVK